MGEYEESAWLVSSILAVVLLFGGIIFIDRAVTFAGILSAVIAASIWIFVRFRQTEVKVEPNAGRKGTVAAKKG